MMRKVLRIMAGRCWETSLIGAGELRCSVLGDFAVRCWETSLFGAGRLRWTVLGNFAVRGWETSLDGAGGLRWSVRGDFAPHSWAKLVHSEEGTDPPRIRKKPGTSQRMLLGSHGSRE